MLVIEAQIFPGKGGVQRTGSLGDVMKESVETARSVVRARAANLGIDTKRFYETDLHVHYPEGATPKDGPSAGIATTTAIISAMTGIPVRSDVAMTGEITLHGEVLEIGGLKEKGPRPAKPLRPPQRKSPPRPAVRARLPRLRSMPDLAGRGPFEKEVPRMK